MDFGYHHASFATEDGSPSDGLIDRAQFLESEGFTWLTLMDHLWQLTGVGYRDDPFMECYAGLSAVAQATDEMELSGLVTCPHYRNPGYLAKLMATVDQVADGRGMLGIGAGWYEAEYEALGIEYPDVSTRVRQLRETIELCRAAWTDPSPVDYEGDHYALDGLYLEPKPDDIPVLVGGAGEQLMLRLVAEYADRWNLPHRSPDTYAHKRAVLTDHCDRYDRSPDDIEQTVTLPTVIRESTDDAHEAYEDLKADTVGGPTPRDEYRGLIGTPAEVAEQIAAFRDHGADTLQIQPPHNDRETIERFVDDVMGEF
jgi:alkanesulfonate monooxygenase SsuD/methylene tetrahydromethanopterin reductase-like flavin-dependent oxidoreductase (luciferase family)